MVNAPSFSKINIKLKRKNYLTTFLWLISLCKNTEDYRSVHDILKKMERNFTVKNYMWLGNILGIMVENKNN
jgi:hypothetical protein